jgi:late competence protein required for DNA uptake (superfamily II DNA/RNA helicase)
MALSLLDEFRAVVAALESEQLEYAVAGALALAVHGAPRATTDIDLLVRAQDVDRVIKLVEPLGYTLPARRMRFSSGIDVQRVTKVEQGENLTLDLIVAEGPLERALASRISVEALEQRFSVVSREALIEMKALAGRLQDLADIQRLQAADDDG